MRLPKLPESKPANFIGFECACYKGKSKYVKYIWEKALLGINNLRSLYPDIIILDTGETRRCAEISYENCNTSNITIDSLANHLNTLASFFDIMDPYISKLTFQSRAQGQVFLFSILNFVKIRTAKFNVVPFPSFNLPVKLQRSVSVAHYADEGLHTSGRRIERRIHSCVLTNF